MTAKIECKEVGRIYPGFALKNISFFVETGYLTGLIGVNGAGKTTLLRILAGLDRDFEGTVLVDGIDVRQNPCEVRQRIGYLSEKLSFFQDKGALENGELLGKYFKNWSIEEYYQWLDRMNLEKTQPLYQFSKGMQMKFQLCFAMAHRPEFLLLDEPTSGFDPVFRRNFLKILQVILAEGAGILMSTHITADLDKTADYILTLNNGEVVFFDTKEALENQTHKVRLEETFEESFSIKDLLDTGEGGGRL